MNPNPFLGKKLVETVHRDYQEAAEEHRRARSASAGSSWTMALRIGIAFSGLILLGFVAMQFISA